MKYNRPQATASWGTQAKDWEKGIDYHRLTVERLKRAQAAIRHAGLAGVLAFNFDNIRYITGTHIGESALCGSCHTVLVPTAGGPVVEQATFLEWRASSYATDNKPCQHCHVPVIDEMGYEGDLDQGWGSLTGEELVLRFWQVVLRGGYATHGETFWRDDEVVFWAKGGELRGESLPRIAFLRELIAASPTGRIDALPSQFDAVWGGAAGRYVLIHFGRGRPRFRDVPVPEGHRARIDVIDSWNRTVERLPGIHEGIVRVDLPARPHIVLRLLLEPAA